MISNDLSRRGFLGLGVMAGAVTLFSNTAAATMISRGAQFEGARKVSFRNTHTNETFSGVYRVGDKYLPDAFEQINVVLRDFRANELFPIDPRVIDIIYTVHQMTGSIEPYDILSGYRCPKTNSGLRSNSEGVAKNSLHMTGQAVDLRLPGVNMSEVKQFAVSLKAGGVGYYPRSNFVHMDSGDVRTW